MTPIEQTKKIKKRIRNYYVMGFFCASILVLCASACACWINHFKIFNTTCIKIIQLLSILPGAAAIYGKKAIPEIWTTAADSTEEKYNERIFNLVSSSGFFLAVWSFQLK
jgi:hypothetical protein